MNVSSYIIRWLEDKGVRTVYGLPGEEDLYLLDSLRTSKINFVRVDHEASAGFMAAAEARVTDRIAVVLTTLGPGATNVLTAIAHAQFAGIPLLLITPDKSSASTHSRFQKIDTVELFKSVTNYSVKVNLPDEIPSILENAYYHAIYSSKQGVSHIQIPYDISKRELSNVKIETGTYYTSVVASDESVKIARSSIRSAVRPIIVTAAGAQDSATADRLNEIVERHSIPFVSTPMGKGSIDERSEKYIGTVISEHDDPLQKALNYSDLIIAIGYESHERAFSLLANGQKKVISFNSHFLELDPLFVPDIQVVGDIATNLSNVFDDLDLKLTDDDFYKSIRRFELGRSANSESLHLRDLIEGMNSELTSLDKVVLDNGTYKWDFARYFLCSIPDQLLLDNALATMGGGIAMGASISRVFPDRKTVTVVGDGGFLMSSYDLGLVNRFAKDQTIIMFRNNKYEMIARKQDSIGLPQYGVDLTLPDVGKIVEGHGIPYSWLHVRETEKILKEIKIPGNSFVEVYFD